MITLGDIHLFAALGTLDVDDAARVMAFERAKTAATAWDGQAHSCSPAAGSTKTMHLPCAPLHRSARMP